MLAWKSDHRASAQLILDNADDLALALAFCPPLFPGHLVLTTGTQNTGKLARRLEEENRYEVSGNYDALLDTLQPTCCAARCQVCAEKSSQARSMLQRVADDFRSHSSNIDTREWGYRRYLHYSLLICRW
jgi:hypothetical protein